jgi:elongation factor P
MYSVSEFRKGLKVEIDGTPYLMVEHQFVKPGKGQAFSRTKLKSLLDGRVIDRTFKIVEKVKKADVTDHKMQYLYQDNEGFHFMDTETYEQSMITADILGDTANWIAENETVTVLKFNGRPITVDLPKYVVLEVTYTEPGHKGDTATGATKTAQLSSGAEVQVPLFINQGDLLKIDTEEGKYKERVRK